MSRRNTGQKKVQRMKELRKLSLKEEVDREAAQIEKEVTEREDLADIKVSEEMETSLFNKIQEYEHSKAENKKSRTVYRKKKRYIVVALAAVIVLVLGSAITSVGSKSYWKVLWDRLAGEEQLSYIDVENMDSQETEDLDEVYIYKEIGNKLGILTVRLMYVPKGMALKQYELDEEQKKATLLYDYNGQIIKYTMYMNNADSSFGQIEPDTVTDQYEVEAGQGIIVQVKEYQIEGQEGYRYIAEFEYMDAQYELKGKMEREEFDKILKNLAFFGNNA